MNAVYRDTPSSPRGLLESALLAITISASRRYGSSTALTPPDPRHCMEVSPAGSFDMSCGDGYAPSPHQMITKKYN